MFILAVVTFHYGIDTNFERSSWAMLRIADIYMLTGRHKYLTITLYSTCMQEELQSFPKLNNMTSFPHFYYVVLTLFASDEVKKPQHLPDAVHYYFLYFLVIKNRTFGEHMKNLHKHDRLPDSKWKITRVGSVILIMHL